MVLKVFVSPRRAASIASMVSALVMSGLSRSIRRVPRAIYSTVRRRTSTVVSPSGARAASAFCFVRSSTGTEMIVSDNDAADPIVWIGAERDEKLHDFRGDAGQEVFTSDPLPGLRHFATVLAAVGRLYVAGDGRISVFGLALGPFVGASSAPASTTAPGVLTLQNKSMRWVNPQPGPPPAPRLFDR